MIEDIVTGDVKHFHLQEILINMMRFFFGLDVTREGIGPLVVEIYNITVGRSAGIKLIVLVTTAQFSRIDRIRSCNTHVARTQTNRPSHGSGDVGV